jgi:FMN phosphatase YigB (HAD superfamily)
MSQLILDLDHTLLNTTAFKLALAESLDLSAYEWEQAYAGFMRDNQLFRVDDFLQGVTPTQREAFFQVVDNLRKYLYLDTLPFLQSAHAAGHQLTIVTFGDEAWQTRKLQGLHLPDYVHTLATADTKVTALAELVNDDTLVVDDRATELEAIVAAYPQVVAYWITRPEGKYTEPIPQCPHHQIESLNQIKL